MPETFVMPSPFYSCEPPRISYAESALNNLPYVEAIFGTRHMGPLRDNILAHYPHWNRDGLIMPIEADDVGGHCEVITTSTSKRPRANCLVTNQPGIVLVGYGADCPGVLAASEDGTVVGMFHSAWWAQADHGVEKLMNGFAHFGVLPHQIHATIGPCIAAQHYNVQLNDYFYETIANTKPLMLEFLDTTNLCFDTRASTEALLKEQGILHIDHIAYDTYSACNSESEYLFYSARRGREPNHNNPWAIRSIPH